MIYSLFSISQNNLFSRRFYRFFLTSVLSSTLFFTGCQKNSAQEKAGQLFLNLYSEPPSLDPRMATDTTSINVLIALFEGLTRIGLDGKPAPALAEKIVTSADGLTYTFHLRESKWSNGDPLTASDFLYTWQTILEPLFPAPYAYKLFVIKNAKLVKEGKLPLSSLGVKVINEHTLQVTLEHPTPYFLELTALPPYSPINRNVDDAEEDWSAESGPQYVSNGPFNLKSWAHDCALELVKNPFYWDKGHVHLKSISLSMIDDTTTEFNMFEQKELDWAGSPLSSLPADIIPSLKKEGRLHSYPVAGGYYYKINTTVFPLTNVNIRKALSFAINRKEIVEHLLQGEERPAMSIVPPLTNEITPRDYFPLMAPAAAKKHFQQGLDELGISKENFPTLHISYNTNREHQKIAEAIQYQWKQILGIETELDHVDWKVYLSKIHTMDYEIARMGWVEDYDDPLSFLEPYQGGNENNNTGWTDPLYTRLLEEAQGELDNEKRRLLLFRAEGVLMEQMPLIPLYFLTYKYLKNPRVKDVYLSPMGIVDYKWAKKD